MTTTYLTSTNKENLSGQTVRSIDLPLGQPDVVSSGTIVESSQSIRQATDNVPVGTNQNLRNVYGATTDHYIGRPSGYNTDGTVNYGDGVTVLTTEWNEDKEITTKGKLSFQKPIGPNVVEYDSL